MAGDVLYIIPLITRLLTSLKKKMVSFYNFFVIIRSVDQQRNSPPKTLATEYAGVDKLPDYLRNDTRDVN